MKDDYVKSSIAVVEVVVQSIAVVEVVVQSIAVVEVVVQSITVVEVVVQSIAVGPRTPYCLSRTGGCYSRLVVRHGVDKWGG